MFPDGVSVLVQPWPYLLFLCRLVLLAHPSLVSVLVCLLSLCGVLRWFLPSLVHASSLDLLKLFHILQKASRRPFALLALNKEFC